MKKLNPLFTNSRGEKLFLSDIYYLKKKVVSVTFSLKGGEKNLFQINGIDLVFAPEVKFVGFRFSNKTDYESLNSSNQKELYKFSFDENFLNRFFIRIPIRNLKSVEWI